MGALMKKQGKNQNPVQALMGILGFTDYGLQTIYGELVFFRVNPTNISVLSSASVEQKIMSLKQLYSLDPEIEVICTDSCECFDNNREYLRQRAEVETNPKVRALLEQDRRMLTEMQTEMSNAREFFFVKRYTGLKPEMVFSQINDTQKRMTERGFEVRRLDRGELKRLTAIYFAASMDGDKMPDVDGGQYAGEDTNGTVQE